MKKNGNKVVKIVVIGILLFAIVFIVSKTEPTQAFNGTIQFENDPGYGGPGETDYEEVFNYAILGKDWRHDIMIYREITEKRIAEQLTDWIAKDNSNPITVTVAREVTVESQFDIMTGKEISSEIFDGLFAESKKISKSLAFTRSKAIMQQYTWTISPTEPGNYFCISLNCLMMKSTISHNTKIFDENGDYRFIIEVSSVIYTPYEHYLVKIYKNSLTGDWYES